MSSAKSLNLSEPQVPYVEEIGQLPVRSDLSCRQHAGLKAGRFGFDPAPVSGHSGHSGTLVKSLLPGSPFLIWKRGVILGPP